jgi:hypothetical protein
MTTWVRRAVTAAAYSGLLLAATARPVHAAPGHPAARAVTTAASPVALAATMPTGTQPPGAAADPTAADRTDAGSTEAGPTEAGPTEAGPTDTDPTDTDPTDTGPPTEPPTGTPTDTPTDGPPTDEPTGGTPSAPQGTEITGSVAMPAGGGQVGGVGGPPQGRRDRQPQGAGAGSDPGGLAATGISLALPLGFAVILLLAGTAAVFAGRRRYRTTPAGTVPARTSARVYNP